jgi:hypothetical protein
VCLWGEYLKRRTSTDLSQLVSNLLQEYFSSRVVLRSHAIKGNINNAEKKKSLIKHLLLAVDNQGQILSHMLINFNGFNTSLFQILTELEKISIVIQLGTVFKTTSPSKNGGNGVGGGLVALLF